MSLLIDLLSEVMAGWLTPETNRGLLWLSTAVGLALALASGWWVANSLGDPNAPDRSIGVLVASVLVGSVGVLLLTLHLVREPAEGGLAAVCLVVNAVAVLLPFVAFVV